MFSKIIKDSHSNEDKLLKKIKTIVNLAKYYNNLQRGIKSKKIYLNSKTQNQEIENFFEEFKNDDLSLVNKLFKEEVAEFLKKRGLINHIDLDRKTGIKQVGLNTIYVEKPISGFWTTGKASFFIPTKKEIKNKITIELYSIPPLNVTIGFENVPLRTIHMSKLSTKKVEVIIESEKIINDISEIYIKTDKQWLPHIILGTNKTIVLGVGIRTIDVSYF